MRQIANYAINCIAALTIVVSAHPTRDFAKTLQRRAISACPTTESYNPYNYFQGVEFLTITGPGATNVDGTYTRHGAFIRNGLPAFRNADLGYYLYYANADEKIWFVSTEADFLSRDLSVPIQKWFNTVIPWCTTDPSGELAVITPFSSEPDQNACLSSPCGSNAFCVDTQAAYDCKCLSGFIADDIITDSCTLDSCSTMEQPCGGYGVCLNSADAFHCECDEGFIYSSNTCIDVDECSQGNICGQGDCTNTPGSYTCTCPIGFQHADSSDTTSACLDIDECLKDPCGYNAYCINSIGSYDCQCKNGYEMTDTGCVDVNECVAVPNACGVNAECRNTRGGFQCQCTYGYGYVSVESGSTQCEDIDECQNADACPIHATCTNTLGSYQCSCNDGYREVDQQCVDRDECGPGTSCPSNSFCFNTEGSYECRCKSGYELNVYGNLQGEIITECVDVDECILINASIHLVATAVR